MHIAVAGNIGSGKTTLTNMLAKRYGWTPRFESVEFNPYLEDFYKDMKRWSFNLQIYFLNTRFKDVVEISKCTETIIQDRTIYEDAKIFAPNIHAMGNMSDRDFANYSALFDLMMSLVKKPDLLIYLRSTIPHLIAKIQKRGREYEQSMQIDYLKGLNDRYEEYTAGAIMTTEFVSIFEGSTVREAMRTLRKEAPTAETIYYIFVVNDKHRLIGRGTETEDVIAERIATARQELEMMSLYDYVVENDEVQNACDRINAIIKAEHCRRERVEKKYLSMLRGE